MDFLKNLSIGDKEKEEKEEQQTPQAQPSVPVAPPEPEHHHSGGFLGKILGGEEDKPVDPPEVSVAKPPVEPKRSSFLEKITGHHEEEQLVPPPPPPVKHESFVEKLSDAIKHDDAPPPPVPAKETKPQSFVGKLFGHDEPQVAPAPPPKEDHHLGHKLSNMFKGEEDKETELQRREEDIKRREEDIKRREEALKAQGHHGLFDGFTHHQETPPPPKDENLFDHLSAKLNHKTNEPPPPQGLKGRVNAILGGGASSEANEDHLDKAIDFVQEHILKAGDQSNESAFEQMTDEQISDTIRRQYKNMTGHDFPLKDKPT